MRMKRLHQALLAFGLILSAGTANGKLSPQSLNISGDGITVSGLSSGGYMATQFHYAHAERVTGVGVIAAGPLYCGQNDIKTALSQCVNTLSHTIPLASLNTQIRQWSASGKIAPLNAIASDKVWLLHGTQDTKVIEPVTDALHRQYLEFVQPENIQYINDKPFAHHFPTVETGTACDTSEAPFLGKCDFDAAGDMLQHLLGSLSPPADNETGTLHTFSQQDWGGDDADSLADTGYLYVPQTCSEGQLCRLHVSFHGCNQNADAVGTQYAAGTGINQWADTNNLVVLYPQTKKSLFMPLNPQACWDWWGYTDEHYATRDGQQIKAVANMIASLTE